MLIEGYAYEVRSTILDGDAELVSMVREPSQDVEDEKPKGRA